MKTMIQYFLLKISPCRRVAYTASFWQTLKSPSQRSKTLSKNLTVCCSTSPTSLTSSSLSLSLALHHCFTRLLPQMASVAVRNINNKRFFTLSPQIYASCCRGSAVASPFSVSESPVGSQQMPNPWWRSMATFTRT